MNIELNILSKHFVVGGISSNYIEERSVKSYHKFLKSHLFNPNIISFDFFEVIEISKLKSIIQDLYFIYLKKYPLAEIEDFKKNILTYTIYKTNQFLKFSQEIEWAAEPHEEIDFSFYRYWIYNRKEYYYYAIDKNKDIEYYIQYFKAALKLLNDLSFLKKKQKETRVIGLKELIFKNGNNASNLSEEFDFKSHEEEYILNNLWGIFKINNVTINDVNNQILKLKNDFITYAGCFDITIFKRDINLDYFILEIKDYLNCFDSRKVNLWTEKKGFFFLTFDIEDDDDQTLLITEKNYIQLEIFFKDILSLIDEFIKENTNNKPQLKTHNNLKITLDNTEEKANEKISNNSNQTPDNKPSETSYTAKELALAYIFDLFSKGEQIPVNVVEDRYSKKLIEKDCGKFSEYKKPNSVYSAINTMRKENIDYNKKKDLENISKRWDKVVINFATDQHKMKKYLEEKQLLKD